MKHSSKPTKSIFKEPKEPFDLATMAGLEAAAETFANGFVDRSLESRPVPIYDETGFEGMRKAGRLAADTLDYITPFVRPGISTAELDRLIEAYMLDHGGIPATKNYKGYPASSCISIGRVVNHGIPSERKLLSVEDTLNIDVTVILDGWFGDTSRMFALPRAKVKDLLLIERTFEAMWAGINTVRPGATLDDVGEAIQTVVEERRHGVGFSVVEEFVGHGVGRNFHDAPEVKHYKVPRKLQIERRAPLVLKPGMFFTIEPMVNAGRPDVLVLADGWTCVTRDKTSSAQFEHTVAVTETGVEVFTRSYLGYEKPPYQVIRS